MTRGHELEGPSAAYSTRANLANAKLLAELFATRSKVVKVVDFD